jgi:glutamate 5-kinase
VGVTAVDGHFQRGDVVHVVNPDGEPIAVGLVNYDADVAGRIRGLSTQQLRELNVLVEGDALIHRDNMVLV